MRMLRWVEEGGKLKRLEEIILEFRKHRLPGKRTKNRDGKGDEDQK